MGCCQCVLQIKLLASPTFSLVTTTYNDKEGIALLNDVIAAITTEIKKRKGNVIVKLAVGGACCFAGLHLPVRFSLGHESIAVVRGPGVMHGWLCSWVV